MLNVYQKRQVHMQTIIFNGSPRKHGDTMALVAELMRHLDGETHVVNAYDGDIAACTDCRWCWQHPGCAIRDGMQRVYDLLEGADNVVIASPVYFSELNGQLLAVMSRLQTYYAARVIRKEPQPLTRKAGALILAAGGDTYDWTLSTGTANVLFRMMNAESIGAVISSNTDKVPAAQDVAALNEVRLLALRLNEMHGGGAEQ